jgi:hypothetical protein
MEGMRAAVLAFLLASGLACAQQTGAAPPAGEAAKPALTGDQIRELFRQVADKDLENDKKQRDYTFTERNVEHKLDGRGRVKSTESKTYEIMELYGEPVRRLVAKNDQPLSAGDAAKEEQKIRKLMDKRKNESEKDREKRIEKEDKDREEGRKFVREVADAYNFRLVNVETLEGRQTYVIDAQPRPGYQPHMRDARILPKFRFRAWIDRDESQWKKIDVECIDTVAIGLFLLRLHKGSRAVIEQTRVNGEVWLPQHIAVKADARLALLKGVNMDVDVTFRDYKKFRSESRIVSTGEQP